MKKIITSLLRIVPEITSVFCIKSGHHLVEFGSEKMLNGSRYTCAFFRSELVRLIFSFAQKTEVISGAILICLSLSAFTAETPKACSYWLSLFKPVCQRLHQIWTEGDNMLLVSGYAWHNRYIYPPEKIHRYNEKAWGGGLGKELFDEKGNWHGLYAIAFLDSHRNVEPAAGYAYLKILNINKDFKAGLGYSILVTSRVDIMHNIPFPGAVPWASIFFKKISIAATYIPGNSSNGNVLYILGKYTFEV